MLPRTHLLKVSDEDLGLLLPGRSIDQFAADALAAGTPLVVVTRGAEGAVGYTRQGRVTAPPVAVQVADTVGAGEPSLLTEVWPSAARAEGAPPSKKVAAAPAPRALMTLVWIGDPLGEHLDDLVEIGRAHV